MAGGNRPRTASRSRVLAVPRAEVWSALAVLKAYCGVCDVSYVVRGRRMGKGTQFRCVPGRLVGDEAPASAPRGEIIEWVPRTVVATRLTLSAEIWTTRIELADAEEGGTRVTMTVTLDPGKTNPIVWLVQRAAAQRLVERTVADELDKIPAHVAQAEAAG